MKTRLTIFLTLLLMLAPAAASAAAPTVKFNTKTHDFGNIRANGGKVTAEYTFTNTGTTPLVIIDVTNGGCGCTTPSFPKAPVAPGKSGKIAITFNPAGRKGEFNREVKVRTNGNPKRIGLQFKGVILP
ncbi:MAG: DUF1573 domain-containing protein [Paramuribaculum sp.]|nr:DUF1573 domain-containing protein [Paramuribaculum sp.]